MSRNSLIYLTVVFLIIFFPLCLSNCAPRLQLVEGGIYSDPQGYFELSIPENGWQLLYWKDVDFALWDQDKGATIVIQVTPLKGDVALSTLARQSLIAFERKQVLSQEAVQVNGRDAVKTLLDGWVEETEIKAEAFVVKGDGVFYDIIFWAPREAFPHTVGAFRQVLDSITFLQH
jgi:hypothetical protein